LANSSANEKWTGGFLEFLLLDFYSSFDCLYFAGSKDGAYTSVPAVPGLELLTLLC